MHRVSKHNDFEDFIFVALRDKGIDPNHCESCNVKRKPEFLYQGNSGPLELVGRRFVPHHEGVIFLYLACTCCGDVSRIFNMRDLGALNEDNTVKYFCQIKNDPCHLHSQRL